MTYEVEVKFRVDDHAALAGRLADRGVLAGVPLAQADLYLAHPTREFSQTDEALRLRRDGSSNRITYKGPKRPGPTKTREEIEVLFAEGPEAREDLTRLFERLGFRPVLEVRKTRLTYQLSYRGRPMIVTLDRVEDLGAFAEVEALAMGEPDLPAAQSAVLALARELELSAIEPRSYLRMALEHRGELPSAPQAAPPSETPTASISPPQGA